MFASKMQFWQFCANNITTTGATHMTHLFLLIFLAASNNNDDEKNETNYKLKVSWVDKLKSPTRSCASWRCWCFDAVKTHHRISDTKAFLEGRVWFSVKQCLKAPVQEVKCDGPLLLSCDAIMARPGRRKDKRWRRKKRSCLLVELNVRHFALDCTSVLRRRREVTREEEKIQFSSLIIIKHSE